MLLMRKIQLRLLPAIASVFVLVLALGLAAGGCRGRRAVRGQVVSGDGGSTGMEVGGGVVAHGTPREQLDQYDQVLRQANYEPVGPVSHGTLDAYGITAIPVDIRRGYCYTLAAIGQTGTDLNLVVLDPRGQDIAHNVLTDEHPWVSFCAQRGGRFVIRLQMARGSGEYFFAPYQTARGRGAADLTSFFGGGAAAPTGPAVATLDSETQARIAALDSTLAAERYSRVGDPQGLQLNEHDERLFQLSLEAGRCYAFASLGGPGTTDTDVYLVDGSGHWIQADSSADRDGLVRFCSPSSGQFTLQIRLLHGSGSVFTAAYVQAPAGPAPTTAPVEPVIADTSTAGAGLDENFALLDADMRARGYESFGAPQHATLAEGGTQEYEVDLEGDKCYAILAVGDSGVRNMDLTLLDSAGHEVDRDDAGDSRPTVRVCPTATGHYRMRVRMMSGTGSYVYAPYRWPRGTHGPFGLAGLIYVRLAEVTALLATEGYAPDANYAMDRGTLRTEGASSQHTLQLSGGQCYSIAAVGGDGIHDLDLALVSGATTIATDLGVRNAFPSVRHCVTTSGTYTLTVRAASGSGPYIYQVFSRTQEGS
jgi:hypothetical protein